MTIMQRPINVDCKTGSIGRHSMLRSAATLAALITALSTDFLTEKTATTIGCMSVLCATLDFGGYFFLGNFEADVNDGRRKQNSAEELSTRGGNIFKRLRKKMWTTLKTVAYFCAFVCVFHLGAVLLGAAITTSVTETFHYSVLMSVLTILPGCMIWGCERNTWLRLTLGSGSQTCWETHLVQTGLATVAGSWFGAFAIPLDWDRPWQVWPVSCVYGALTGHLVANVYTLFVELRPPASGKKRKHV